MGATDTRSPARRRPGAQPTHPGYTHHDDDGETQPFDLDRYPKIKAAVEKHTERENGGGTDRSDDTYRIVAVCKEAGLTIGNAWWAVRQRGDLAERLDERGDDDIETVWKKVEGEVTNDQLTLPPVFWQRPALVRIRQIAYAETAAPDAVPVAGRCTGVITPTSRPEMSLPELELPVLIRSGFGLHP